jgi:hypothetical protein
MPSDERERQFERALQRHMREKSAEAACPDAETLAAYHERTLSLEEMARWKEHIGGCVRCQETLALVEETDAIPANDWEGQKAGRHEMFLGHAANLPKAHRAMRAEPLQQDEQALPETAMSAGPMAAAKTTARRSSWKWMAPLGALAAGLLLFVVVRERKVAVPASTVEVAQNREVAEMEKRRVELQAPKREESEEPAKDVPALAGKTAKRESAAVPAAPNAPAPNRDVKLGAVGNDQQLTSKADAVTSREVEAKPSSPEQVRAEQQMVPELDAAKTKAAGEAASAPPPSAKATGAVAAPAVSRAKKESGTLADKANSVGAAAPTEATTGLANRPTPHAMLYSTNVSGLRKMAATDPRMILAPDGKHAWRVGTAGMIEATADGGRVWSLQASGVLTDLQSGSAVSESVCWVVGKVGTVLLTTNGGKHWAQIVSPVQEDLGGVHAVDARQASIWNVPNNKSFETVDGGVTWTPTANE